METPAMVKRTWINKRSPRAFYTLFTFLNVAFIGIFVKFETELTFFPAVFLILSATLFNLSLALAYCHEGRSALKNIPFIAGWFAIIYALAGIFLGQPNFATPGIEHVYRVAQLFVGESAWIEPVIQNQADSTYSNTLAAIFNLARIAALLATVSVVLALVRQMTDWARVSARPRKWTDHTVLCGLGEAGMEFVKLLYEDDSSEAHDRKKKLLIIEHDESNQNVETARNLGAAVLIGDVFSKDVQARARLAKANTVIMMLSDDKRNIELALETRELVRAARESDKEK